MESGIYNISNEDYHASAGISRSGISRLKMSPFHYWNAYLNPDKAEESKSKSMNFGDLVHRVLLDKEDIYRDDFTKAQLKTYHNVMQACEAILSNPKTGKFIDAGGLVEKSIYWVDEETGVLCKARPDTWFDDIVIDIKTTVSAKKEDYKKSVIKYDYHIQAAMMLDAIENATGKRPCYFAHIVVENKSPFATALYFISDEKINLGQYEYKQQLQIYKECLAKNEWPSYQYEDCYI